MIEFVSYSGQFCNREANEVADKLAKFEFATRSDVIRDEDPSNIVNPPYCK